MGGFFSFSKPNDSFSLGETDQATKLMLAQILSPNAINYNGEVDEAINSTLGHQPENHVAQNTVTQTVNNFSSSLVAYSIPSKCSPNPNNRWLCDGGKIFSQCFGGFFDLSVDTSDLRWTWEVDCSSSRVDQVPLLSDWNRYFAAKSHLLIQDPTACDLPVRLILTPLVEQATDNNLKSFITNTFGIWGATHAELQVGPFIFSWDTNEMCLPRCFTRKDALVVADLGFMISRQNHQAVMKKFCHRIAEWNSYMYYNVTGYNSLLAEVFRHGNCQAFVEDLMKVLGIQWTARGMLGQYLKELRGNKVRQPFGGIWNSHAKFDAAWYSLKHHHVLTEDELELYKAIDRAFTLREGRSSQCPYLETYPPQYNYFVHESAHKNEIIKEIPSSSFY